MQAAGMNLRSHRKHLWVSDLQTHSGLGDSFHVETDIGAILSHH